MSRETSDNLQRILDTTLGAFLDLVQCDAGSVYTLRQDEAGEPILKFEAMITRSIHLQGVPEHVGSLQFRIDDSSIVGRTAAHRKAIVLNLDSAENHVSPCVAKILNYVTRNIFSGPLITPRGDLVGVVQLLNKLPADPAAFRPEDSSPLPPFDEKDERLFSMIVGQSALAIENSLLLQEQERLIEGFVDACVTAIEARDPITSGHSVRVATYTVGLAEAVNRTSAGPLRDTLFTAAQMRELRFASMLHDVGKIGVKEEVLHKQKKLLPHELEIIGMRLKLMRARMMYLQQTERQDYGHAINRLGQAWRQVLEANEPSIVNQPAPDVIAALRSLAVPLEGGEMLTALTSDEVEHLSLMKGSLSEPERIEIESHVNKTFEILKLIPWSRGLEQVPDIAYKHHENLDGTGYPRQITAECIPPQTRIMTICDIYDALRAGDRPYKPALLAESALDIIAGHVKAGKLDQAYFDVFVQAQIFNLARAADFSSGGAAA